MKPGYKSTENVNVIFIAGLTALNKTLDLGISDDMLLTLAGLVAVYVAQRGWVKTKGAADGT